MDLRLSTNALDTIIRTVVESGPLEPMGYIFYKKRGSGYSIESAYPLITADRKPTQVSYGNQEAINRLRKLCEAMKASGRNFLIGGYHSHPLREKDDARRTNRLSLSDLDFLDGDMQIFHQESWIELLVKIESRKLNWARAIGISSHEYRRKAKFTIQDSLFHQHRLTCSAYLVYPLERASCNEPSKNKPSSENYEVLNIHELKVKISAKSI